MFKAGMTPTGHMRRALRLAKKGEGWVLPNPMVGALIVKNGKRIGEAWHQKFGEDHAEVLALKSCTESCEGATLYVTLEPCNHQGKTPPCTKAIIESGIKKVVIAGADPSRAGAEELRKAGLEVELGLLENEARAMNAAFYTFHERKRPFITLKAAISIDGKISSSSATQTKLSGKQAQKKVHKLRHEHHAILIGANTLKVDDPHLGVRDIEGRDPLRILLSHKELAPNTHFLRDNNHLILKGSIKEILKTCYKKGILSILVEGGQKVFDQFLKEKCVDQVILFQSPILLGSKAYDFSKEPIITSFKRQSVQKCGRDLMIQLTPEWEVNNS